MSVDHAPTLVLASTSPQRSAILGQLRIPFEVVPPLFEEEPGGDPLEHAAGKARSVDGSPAALRTSRTGATSCQ